MSEINYEDTRIEGGIRAFDGVTKPDQSKAEIGNLRVPSPEQAKEYARFLESVIEAQQIPKEDEDLLAAA